MDLSDPRAVLRRYLQAEREALLWKLDGLGERAVRMPRTPTGTSLVGIVKHCANVEIARHAGQADILREQIDSAVGQSAAHAKIPDDVDGPEYVAKLTAIAEQFPE